jgi:hypothetical protein
MLKKILNAAILLVKILFYYSSVMGHFSFHLSDTVIAKAMFYWNVYYNKIGPPNCFSSAFEFLVRWTSSFPAGCCQFPQTRSSCLVQTAPTATVMTPPGT